MEYAKYIYEKTIKKAQKVIFEESIYIANPTEEILLAHGYKPLVETEQLELNENEYVKPFYSEEEDRIVLSWIVKKYEIEETNPDEEEVENG